MDWNRSVDLEIAEEALHLNGGPVTLLGNSDVSRGRHR
jgi:hypothetical protein